MELFDIQRLKVCRVDENSVRVSIVKDGVNHVKDAATFEQCFDALDNLFSAPDYQQNLKEYKTSIGLK